MRRNVLVAGGAGYIGSHVCKALAAAGHHPITFDSLVHGHAWAVKWGPLVKGDIADTALLKRVLRRYDVRAVVHLAAYAYVGESMRDPGKYFSNNVAGTISLLNAMVAAGTPCLVLSSTCATYGLPEVLPIDESHPQRPVNPYGESKLCVERALQWYEGAHGLRSVALRYFNAAGADREGDIGEDHDPETHLIPLAIQAVLGLRKELQVLGTAYATPDGTAIRDFTHVTDLAAAHVAALDYLAAGNRGVMLNLGTGRGHSVREVIREVERVAGRRVPSRDAPPRPGDPPVLVAASERAARLLGWQPQQSDLATLVETAWRWHLGRRGARALRSAA
jgi:UDP-arabinose 4-epimerase